MVDLRPHGSRSNTSIHHVHGQRNREDPRLHSGVEEAAPPLKMVPWKEHDLLHNLPSQSSVGVQWFDLEETGDGRMSYRILVRDGIAPKGIELLETKAEVIEEGDLEELGSVDAVIVRSRTKMPREAIMKAAPRLRVIGRAGVGVDNIDLQAAKEAGVVVVNAPQASSIAVAEHALALMLALSRKIPFADSSMRRGEWAKKQCRGVELFGKTLGLIGLGRIGAELGMRAKALGMQVLGYDAFLKAEEITACGAQAASKDELLRQSDYISLHVPLTKETRDLIDSAAIARMKQGAFLICTARGGIVNEAALLWALNAGRLGGAALDVFLQEPPGESPLIQHPNVISTPHIAAQTAEAQERAGIDIAMEVLAALNGETLRWRVV